MGRVIEQASIFGTDCTIQTAFEKGQQISWVQFSSVTTKFN